MQQLGGFATNHPMDFGFQAFSAGFRNHPQYDARVYHSMLLVANHNTLPFFADQMARNPLNGFAAILTSKTSFAATNLQVGSLEDGLGTSRIHGKSTLQIQQLMAYLL